MKKIRFSLYNASLFLLIFSYCITAQAQFQTKVGLPAIVKQHPVGIVQLGGGYAIIAGNTNHPASPFGPGTDWEFVRLNAAGSLISPSQWIGRTAKESVAWIDTATCGGQSRLIVAGNDDSDMSITLLTPGGVPVWSRKTGTNAFTEYSACVKVDGAGNFILAGTQLRPGDQKSIVACKVDCNGNKIWDVVFGIPTFSVEVSSVNIYATFTGICPQPNNNRYYITGKITPMGGGDDKIFLLSLDATTGAYNSMIVYDALPNIDYAGTWLELKCLTTAQPEIWISGYAVTATGAKTVLLLKTDINGQPVWSRELDVSGGDEYASHFTLSPGGQIILAGKAGEASGSGGNCMLMRIDGNGNYVDWTRIFNNWNPSQGNRVEQASNGGYFITGEATLTPDILAILTDNTGQTVNPGYCYSSLSTNVIPLNANATMPFPASSISLSQLDFFQNSLLATQGYSEQQSVCQPCECTLEYTTEDCYKANFTVTCDPLEPGLYSFEWDYENDGITDEVLNTPVATHVYPCGGGTFTAHVSIIAPSQNTCEIIQSVEIPNTCCGDFSNAIVACTPSNNQYSFSFQIGYPQGVDFCDPPVVNSLTSGVTLSDITFSSLPNALLVSGFAQVPDVAPTSLAFSVHRICYCPVEPGEIPNIVECNTSLSIPTPCCDSIKLYDQTICQETFSLDIPIDALGGWTPLDNIQEVHWYIIPKPAGGDCPPPPWANVISHQFTNTPGALEPFHIYPSSLAAGDYCVYATVKLLDGPCLQLLSNVATLTICQPNTCSLNDQEYCFTGSPVTPDPLNLTVNASPATCPITLIEWFDPQGNLVQTGGTTYIPTEQIIPQWDQLDLCYVDTFYKVEITDACGIHTCKARIRLYNNPAPVGLLAMDPEKPPFLCYNSDATLVFTPTCISEPQSWQWYRRDCDNNAPEQIADTGPTLDIHNTGKLTKSYYYFVEGKHGDNCLPDTVQLLVKVKPLVDYIFNAGTNPCVEDSVRLTLSLKPCEICGEPCTCLYDIYWQKDGELIGTTLDMPTASSTFFTYYSDFLAGTYYASIEADCCPGEIVQTYAISFALAGVPVIMGPCTICDNEEVQLMVTMVLPPDDPYPSSYPPCSFFWYRYFPDAMLPYTEPIIAGDVLNTTTAGYYIVESDCDGCIRRDTFQLTPCSSNPCGRLISVEELETNENRLVRVYPNPAMDKITIAWIGDAPQKGQVVMTDLSGKVVHTIALTGMNQMQIEIDRLPVGMYFLKIQSDERWFNAAKIVIE
ncbi:MAG: T9SS type A sorting domain-containing protein [Saprospirales bacterium]|nr:T9SS type A sorting domain-containing protein [Saprospirales bacterium]